MEIKIRVGAFALALIIWFSWNTAVSMANSFKIWELEKKYEVLKEGVVGEIKMQVCIDVLIEIFQKFSNRVSNLTDNIYILKLYLSENKDDVVVIKNMTESILRVGNACDKIIEVFQNRKK